ncbi:mitochondrial ribosomal death-associated protein 3-domain-containing protein [Cristinia sonorae]|uniref:Small ribosomal subunit protein mS29 n=1 Tax=Cristinia sonorae TaxID=1940300 RepID=A0A8K0UVS7_9AGAR|nr:mitochondrial ribosomal death-associated protein 3-domain-containing protein [Cristinia sonorae]
MFSLLASSSVRPTPSLHILSSRVGREQVRHATKKAGGNRQVLASKTTKLQKGFRMKKKDKTEKPKMAHDGVWYMKPMADSKLKAPLFQEPRAVLEYPVFRPEEMTANLSLGKARSFPPTATKMFKTYGVPRNVLVDFRVLSSPTSVVRDVTLRLADQLDKAVKSPSTETRLVFTGSAGNGKSYLMLQAIAYAKSIGYLVVYVPRASRLVDSSTAYVYDARTQTYAQPKYSSSLLSRILTVNDSSLQQLKLHKDFLADDGSVRLHKGSPLVDLIDLGVRDASVAHVVLSAVFEELAKQTQFPVLLAVDDFQSFFNPTTLYRNPSYGLIKPYHLSLPRLLMEYSSHHKGFARGAVIGAVSGSNTNWPVTLELQEALGLSTPRPVNEYAKRSDNLQYYAEGLKNFPVPEKLTLDEAASIYDMWHKDNALHTHANDELFLSKYTEACGNARKFVWEGLLRTLVT